MCLELEGLVADGWDTDEAEDRGSGVVENVDELKGSGGRVEFEDNGLPVRRERVDFSSTSGFNVRGTLG